MIYVAIVIAIVIICARIKMLEKYISEALCELMTAVFNADAVKAKCQEAAENGEKYVEL